MEADYRKERTRDGAASSKEPRLASGGLMVHRPRGSRTRHRRAGAALPSARAQKGKGGATRAAARERRFIVREASASSVAGAD